MNDERSKTIAERHLEELDADDTVDESGASGSGSVWTVLCGGSAGTTEVRA
jgi:hypothetical protein